MRTLKLAMLAAATLLATAAGLTTAAGKPHGDWTGTVTRTASGSHVLGNPDAKVKLVEFVSYTCPHCGDFHKASHGPLRIGYVPGGKVSVEVRHIVRDPVDLAAAVLTNCGDGKKFFQRHNTFMMKQEQWMKSMGSASATQKSRWSNGPIPARLRAIAADFGFYKLMSPYGLSRAAVDRCFADEALARRLVTGTQDALSKGVEGTPSFMLSDTLLAETHGWATLEPKIKAAM